MLLTRSDIDTVYCAIRGRNPADRLQASFSKRKLGPLEHIDKVRFLKHDPGRLADDLEEMTREDILGNLSHIIHAAWPVNFQIPLAGFHLQLKDLQDLIQLSLDVKLNQPAQVLYCSSMGVALNTHGQRRIAEAPIMDFRQGLGCGYTESKLVAEYIIQRAVEDSNASAHILRIGQVVGDTKSGVWNDNEAIPMMIRSALTLGCLPALDMVSLRQTADDKVADFVSPEMFVDPS